MSQSVWRKARRECKRKGHLWVYSGDGTHYCKRCLTAIMGMKQGGMAYPYSGPSTETFPDPNREEMTTDAN